MRKIITKALLTFGAIFICGGIGFAVVWNYYDWDNGNRVPPPIKKYTHLISHKWEFSELRLVGKGTSADSEYVRKYNESAKRTWNYLRIDKITRDGPIARVMDSSKKLRHMPKGKTSVISPRDTNNLPDKDSAIEIIPGVRNKDCEIDTRLTFNISAPSAMRLRTAIRFERGNILKGLLSYFAQHFDWCVSITNETVIPGSWPKDLDKKYYKTYERNFWDMKNVSAGT